MFLSRSALHATPVEGCVALTAHERMHPHLGKAACVAKIARRVPTRNMEPKWVNQQQCNNGKQQAAQQADPKHGASKSLAKYDMQCGHRLKTRGGRAIGRLLAKNLCCHNWMEAGRGVHGDTGVVRVRVRARGELWGCK